MRLLVSATLALVAASSWSRVASADEPVRPVQHNPEAYPPSSVPTKLMLFGGAVTLVSYAAVSVPTLLWHEAPGARNLRYPVLGPWMAFADKGYMRSEHTDETWWVVVRAVLTGLDGVAQAGGLALILEGALLPAGPGGRVTTPSKHAVRMPKRSGIEIHPVPWLAGSGGVGLGVIGLF